MDHEIKGFSSTKMITMNKFNTKTFINRVQTEEIQNLRACNTKPKT